MNKDKKERILIFSTAYFPMVGGAEVAIRDLTNRLENYEFDLICARFKKDFPKTEKLDQVIINRVGWGSGWDKFLLPFLGLFKALALHRQKGYAGIWSVMASYNSLAALFFKIFHPQTPFLLTLQEGDSAERIRQKTAWFSFLFKRIFRRADFVQVISQYLADFARTMKTKAPVEVVPNPVNIEKFSLSPEQKFQIRQKIRTSFALGGSEKLVVSVSRLVSKNGLATLIKAMALVPESKLVILGGGPLREELKTLVEKLNIGNRIFFLGPVDHKKVPEYLAAADIFCRPSLSEGLGTAFLEAMAAGLPVVATPVGGITDFLQDGQTGLLARPNSPEDLAAKIKLLCQNEELAERLAGNGQELIQKNYTQEIVVGKMRNIFERVFI